MQRKGQAAMEFLMTYGWAILAAVIAIGVLAYFGVFSPQNIMPKACTIAAPFGCDDFKINTSGVTMILRNGAGEDLNLTSYNLTNCADNASTINFPTGATMRVTYDCDPSGRFKGNIEIGYKRASSTFPETVTGTVSGKVETS